MDVQRLSPADFTVLSKPGIRSEQIVWPGNAPMLRLPLRE
jgi:hypothetical protein